MEEAKNLSSLSADASFQEGLNAERQHRDAEAIIAYKQALSIDSNHKDSLIHLAALSHKQHDISQAEQYLFTVIRNDQTSHEAWYLLGVVLTSKGDLNKACECFETSIELERTAPLISYSKIKKLV